MAGCVLSDGREKNIGDKKVQEGSTREREVYTGMRAGDGRSKRECYPNEEHMEKRHRETYYFVR